MNYKEGKITVALLVLTSFLAIGIFGFVFMGHGEGHDSQKCIVATSEKADCAEASQPLDSALFHLNAFKSFSLGVLQLMALTAGVALLSFWFSRWQMASAVPPAQARYRTQRSKSPSFHDRTRWLRWLALRQKTDSF